MKMKSVKRSMAALLATLLILPTQSADAANLQGSLLPDASEKRVLTNVSTPGNAAMATPGDAEDDDLIPIEEELENDLFWEEELATVSDAELVEEIIYNTGNREISVVSYEDFTDYGLGDEHFEEDGSYTIEIPETDPYYPYEVQFTCDGETESRWFMDPDDSVEVGGYTFYTDADFTGDEVTQMTLNVGGDSVVVYPEAKTFTDGMGKLGRSLLPLDEVNFNLDLTGYTPVELTKVSIESVFAGNAEVLDTDKIVWTMQGDDDYQISSKGDLIDLSYNTYNGRGSWQMIVGEADQLAASNKKYFINIETTESFGWLVPTVYARDQEGGYQQVTVDTGNSEYWDPGRSYSNGQLRSQDIDVIAPDFDVETYLVSLEVRKELFDRANYDHLKIYEGEYATAEEAEKAVDITNQLLNPQSAEQGYALRPWQGVEVTIVAYDVTGEVVGCLPVSLELMEERDDLYSSLINEAGERVSIYSYGLSQGNSYNPTSFELYEGYAADAPYRLVMTYDKVDISNPAAVLGAFIGKYPSISAAKSAGAADIAPVLFDKTKGYTADFSAGVPISVFIGTDAEQKLYSCTVKTEEGVVSNKPSGSTWVTFTGINGVPCDVIDMEQDDYAEQNFFTILVNADTDLTSLAPTFEMEKGIKLYAAGANTEEESGVSTHDFSHDPVQYTVSAEDKENSKNYWLQVVKPSAGNLYVNSFEDPESETVVKDGVIYSTREMFLSSSSHYKHDILLVNMGTEAIPAISVTLESNVLELDEYWTLGGVHELGAFTAAGNNDASNQAKLRLKMKDGVISGSEISGTLTIKSGTSPLVVFTLVGVAGEPVITTTSIPEAVKYVHYGTMIQNSNKYASNKITYGLSGGSLPAGMVIKPNGELYGVPTESGAFRFTVRMSNSISEFGSRSRSFTLKVNENTDINVDNATDQTYELIERVPDITLSDRQDYTMTSVGVFSEWENLYLDGKMLTEGVDYDAESGSTRLTIRSQTLRSNNTPGTHTLSAEFRTADTKSLRRAAQNYKVLGSDGNSSSDDSDSSSDSSYSSSSDTNVTDPKRGHVSSDRGIITGAGTGYSRWMQDENGWKLVYADGSVAAGRMIPLADGSQAEQVLWEKINGSYYSFGVNSYLVSGWIFDYQLNEWYFVSEENGMRSGWYTEPQDGFTYYLDPFNGALSHGWKEIDGNWYYLNEVSAAPTWVYDPETKNWFYNTLSRTKPWGALYHGEKTPDGYRVDESGAWDGQPRS